MKTVSTPRRAAFARLVAVFAALVGMAMVDGGQCHAAMPMGAMEMVAVHASTPMDMTQSMTGAHQMSHVDHEATATAARPDQVVDTTADGVLPPVGVVMACLAVFLALLAALVMVRSGTAVSPLPVALLRWIPLRCMVRSRKPSLHQLCILRT